MVVLAVHGGAGGDGPWRGMTDADPQRVACMRALLDDIGHRLADGSLDALEAVTLAVEAMEDEALFNAGRGSVLDASGSVTMDASIMRGHDRAAGAVIGLRSSRHPIRVAHHLLVGGWPLMLAGSAGDDYGASKGVEQVGQDWLLTDLRRAQWSKWKEQRLRPGATDEDDALLDHDGEQDGWGTVGAVALDAQGQLAAATSTGGMTGKPLGRVGDTPIIGAGAFAWDETCAVSSTGHGEPFVRLSVGARISAWVEIGGMDLVEAASRVVQEELAELDGKGGVIAVDSQGRIAMPFSTAGMFRAAATPSDTTVAIW